MGDISIIARRLTPEYVQYGWSGNGGYYRSVGALLLEEYNTPERVEYLFGLGQLSHLFLPHSEETTHWLRTSPTGQPHWVDNTERKIFSLSLSSIMAISMTVMASGITSYPARSASRCHSS